MEDVEESIIDRGKNANSRTMLTFRRKLLRIDTYYQQLVDMASGIAENENGLLSKEESRLFLVAERQAERLLKRSLTLKEYSLQLARTVPDANRPAAEQHDAVLHGYHHVVRAADAADQLVRHEFHEHARP